MKPKILFKKTLRGKFLLIFTLPFYIVGGLLVGGFGVLITIPMWFRDYVRDDSYKVILTTEYIKRGFKKFKISDINNVVYSNLFGLGNKLIKRVEISTNNFKRMDLRFSNLKHYRRFEQLLSQVANLS
jgi:hypothetical protein